MKASRLARVMEMVTLSHGNSSLFGLGSRARANVSSHSGTNSKGIQTFLNPSQDCVVAEKCPAAYFADKGELAYFP